MVYSFGSLVSFLYVGYKYAHKPTYNAVCNPQNMLTMGNGSSIGAQPANSPSIPAVRMKYQNTISARNHFGPRKKLRIRASR